MHKFEDYTFEIIGYELIKEELEPFENSQEEPIPFIRELMKGKSKEEQLMASDNFMGLIDLAERVVKRLSEEEKKDKEELINESENSKLVS